MGLYSRSASVYNMGCKAGINSRILWLMPMLFQVVVKHTFLGILSCSLEDIHKDYPEYSLGT